MSDVRCQWERADLSLLTSDICHLSSAVVQVSVTPMLAARSSTAEQVSQAILATPVRIREQNSRWARVLTPDGYEGWTPAGSISSRPYPPAEEVMEIADLWANLRARPDSQLGVAITAFIGCRLNLHERKGEWLGLELPDRRVLWVEEHRARPVVPGTAPTPEQVVATAERFLGVPYLWGGCTPMGLDCSGFVQLVYRLHGIALPRDAHQQAACGAPVEGDEYVPGDLLFFARDAAGDGAITHVGMARGEGTFVHARGGQAVRIDRLADAEYQRRFVGARRWLSSHS
jgi:hypothetical protein